MYKCDFCHELFVQCNEFNSGLRILLKLIRLILLLTQKQSIKRSGKVGTCDWLLTVAELHSGIATQKMALMKKKDFTENKQLPQVHHQTKLLIFIVYIQKWKLRYFICCHGYFCPSLLLSLSVGVSICFDCFLYVLVSLVCVSCSV